MTLFLVNVTVHFSSNKALAFLAEYIAPPSIVALFSLNVIMEFISNEILEF